MPLTENFEIPQRYKDSHDIFKVKRVRHAGWYLVPKEAFKNLDDTSIQYKCWLINPLAGTITQLPYQLSIVDLGL